MDCKVLCTLRKDMRKDKKQIVKFRAQSEGVAALSVLGIAENELCTNDIAQIGNAYMGGEKVVVYKLGGAWNVRQYNKTNVALAVALGGFVVDAQIRRATQNESAKVCEAVTEPVQKYESEGKVLGEMSTIEIFEMCKGRSSKKHGERGGADFDAQSKMYGKKAQVLTRPWKRGEKTHLRNANKKALQQTIKEERILNSIFAAKYGLIYRPSAHAVKVSFK